MSKLTKRSKAVISAIVFLLVGVIAIVVESLWLTDPSLALVKTICLYGGIGLCAVAVVIIIFCISSANKAKRKAKEKSAQQQVEAMPDAQASIEEPTTYNGSTVTYVPSCEAQTFMEMGAQQSVDEKFEQIAKMDKTQFVVYVARLFSRKGYQVKLTPVFDNYNIDMLVEKMGTVIAVGCILTNRILGEKDISPIVEGKHHYTASNVMALTNMYFDRTALDFAKANRMSLVDRVILTEDFMN